MSDEALLSVRDVSLRFGGVAALDSVSFDIVEGQIVGLIGPNGAGKTSLFNCISRLYQPTGGSIRLEHHELLRLRAHEVIRLGIARTFQNVALFARMSVLDNVLVGDHNRIRAGARAGVPTAAAAAGRAGRWAQPHRSARAGRADQAHPGGLPGDRAAGRAP